jgi:acyl-CoA synthetase (NDP forming)
MGYRAWKNLSRYKGKIFLINLRSESIAGERCYPSIAALPETPDCVVIAVPRDAVIPSVRECAERGVGGVVVFASNFAEAGDSVGIHLQAELVSIAGARRLPIVGPNTIGVANLLSGAVATFAASMTELTAAENRRDGSVATPRIGLASQSGGVGFSLSLACQRGVAFSHVLTTGNSADVDIADFLSYLADDPGCRSIACLFEGMPDPMRLAEAAEIARAAGKPIVVHKMATGSAGAEAALSHTGQLAGSAAAYRALFRRAGIVEVGSLDALIETAGFFARIPRQMKSRGVAVATSSGGLAVMCADKAEEHAVPLPQPSEATKQALMKLIPDFGSPRNPCDVTAQIQSVPTMLAAAGDAFLSDAAYGTLVVTYPTPGRTDVRMRAVDEVAARHGKMLVNLWTNEALERPEVQVGETLAHGAVMRTMDRCFHAIRSWHELEDLRAAGPRALKRRSPGTAVAEAAALIGNSPNQTLTEREAKAVLACYGVPVTGERLVGSRSEAVEAARTLGLPAVLKVESPDLPHKTEAGVIRLHLRTEAEVAEAFDDVMANARKVSPAPRINGVLVQPMAFTGVEVMIGARIDPLFGPLVLAGLGGILVELMKDSSLELAPVNAREATAMLDRLKGAAMLRGFRKLPAVDVDALADVIVRVSEFAADQKERIAELDINPLICAGSRIVAVDALIVKKQAA